MLSEKAYLYLTGTIFSILAIIHVIRLIQRWEAVIGGVEIPLWVSVIAVLLSAFLAFRAFWLVKK